MSGEWARTGAAKPAAEVGRDRARSHLARGGGRCQRGPGGLGPGAVRVLPLQVRAGRSRTSTYVRTLELGLAHNQPPQLLHGGRAGAGGAVLSSYPSLVDQRSITEAAGADRGREGSSNCLSKTRIHAKDDLLKGT